MHPEEFKTSLKVKIKLSEDGKLTVTAQKEQWPDSGLNKKLWKEINLLEFGMIAEKLTVSLNIKLLKTVKYVCNGLFRWLILQVNPISLFFFYRLYVP